MNALTDWLETSSKKNDHMKKGTLTEVTDSHNNDVIAYIVPTTDRSEKGLYEIMVLWISDKCSKKNTHSFRTRKQKQDIIYRIDRNNVMFLYSPFIAVGKGHCCIPYHNPWINYEPIAKKKLPMYIGLSGDLDRFIAEKLQSGTN